MVNFEDGILEEGAYVVINGIKYPVQMPKYKGNTPFTSENMNKLQKDIIDNDIPIKIVTGQEFETNEYVDGKRLYGKIIDFGALPNNSSKIVSHGLNLSNIDLYRVNGVTSNGIILPSYRTDPSFAIEFYLSSEGVVIITHTDRSNYTATISLYYTKN